MDMYTNCEPAIDSLVFAALMGTAIGSTTAVFMGQYVESHSREQSDRH